MQIKLKEIPILDLVTGYKDSNEEGVMGYNGKLNIRPKYQREFIYDRKQQEAVINTIINGFPLNTMYWVDNEKSGYELLDGQQRTLSICTYVSGAFSIKIGNKPMYFHNLDEDTRKKILNYKLMIYFCSGSDHEKLDWFRIINIAGEKLNEQELRNAVYTGEWLTSAKAYFSKTGCVAYQMGSDYIKGIPIRQELLETVIGWISDGDICKYMSENQNENNANALWSYYSYVISWVKTTFPNYRKEMKGVDWGFLYNKFGKNAYNTSDLEEEIKKLMQDEDVTKKSGIYPYILTKEEKYLSIRSFTDNQKRESFERQSGKCLKCEGVFEIKEMEADHITPWHKGGKTISDNCQMLCKHCNRVKSGK